MKKMVFFTLILSMIASHQSMSSLVYKEQKMGLREVLQPYAQKTISQYPPMAKSEKELLEKTIDSFSNTVLEQNKYVTFKFSSKDSPFIKSLFLDSWAELVDGEYNENLLNSIIASIETNESRSKRDYNVKKVNTVAIKSKKADSNSIETIGFIKYVLYEERESLKLGHIELIGIRQDHRKNKLGTLLLTHAIKDLITNGAYSVHLYVKKNNEPAIKCYEKLGFKFYSTVDDINVMLKS